MRRYHLAVVAVALAIPACQRNGLTLSGATDAPTFQYAQDKGSGCADLFLYTGTADGTEYLTISADREKLHLPAPGARTFDLAEVKEGLEVAVDIWEVKPANARYCTDIDDSTALKARWVAKRGLVTIIIAEPVPNRENPNRTYKASVRLENVEFEDSTGRRAMLKEQSITDVLVGWYAG